MPALEGYCTAEQTAPGEWQGQFFQKHPAPSGFERHILRFSDNRRFPTADEATAEIQAAVDRMNAPGMDTCPKASSS